MSQGTELEFDLTGLGEVALRAILDGLTLDGDHLLARDFDGLNRRLSLKVDGPETAAKLKHFVAGLKQSHKRLARRILAGTSARAVKAEPIDTALRNCGDLEIIGPGLVGLGGRLLRLFRFFEGEFRGLAAQFDAEERHYPAMLPAAMLAEMGYLGHFPQHVTFCSHLPDSLPVLDRIASEARAGEAFAAERIAAALDPPGHVLCPGVCLPCYAQQRGRVLAAGEIRTLTMQNHVFRYEANRFQPLARGWDFTVRDIVFFGSGSDLVRLRQAVMDKALQLCRDLDLDVTIELANDPFFLDANRDKVLYQRLGEVKYELLFNLPHAEAPLAAASFNLHRDFYTALYDTRVADGRHAESACMGFGIDRWLYGFLAQKGLDPAGWPEPVRALA